MNRVIFLFAIVVLFSKNSFCQGKTEGLPISVKINTAVAFSDGSVEIVGVSNSLDNDPGQVIIEIIKPNGGTDNFTSRADKQTGEYFLKYMPSGMGEYKVIAYASDKKQTANTTFTVQAEFDADEVLESFDKTKDKTMASVESAVNAAVATDAKPEDVAKRRKARAAAAAKDSESSDV